MNRSRMVRAVVSAGLALVAIAGTVPARAQDEDRAGDQRGPRAVLFARPQPEHLMEAPPLSEAARLQMKTKRSIPFCDAMQSLVGLEEPAPDDYDGLYTFASSYYGITSSLDFTKRVEVTEKDGKSEPVPVPDVIVDAILDQQAQAYAFMVRVTVARQLKATAGHAATERLRREAADYAFLQLVNSEFTAAEGVLTAGRGAFCG